jgi:hypothetical protein
LPAERIDHCAGDGIDTLGTTEHARAATGLGEIQHLFSAVHTGQRNDWNPNGFAGCVTEKLEASPLTPADDDDRCAVVQCPKPLKGLVGPRRGLDQVCREIFTKALPRPRRATRVRLEKHRSATKTARRFKTRQEANSLTSIAGPRHGLGDDSSATRCFCQLPARASEAVDLHRLHQTPLACVSRQTGRKHKTQPPTASQCACNAAWCPAIDDCRCGRASSGLNQAG